MSLGWLAKMLHLFLCPVLLVAVQTLTIDSQLGTSIEDCFERISIGQQLLNSAIYRNVSELTTRECEQICRQDKQCQAYDYGVGAKGNATCDLSTHSEKDVKEQSTLSRHPDYDVYVRRFQCEQAPPTPIQTLLDEPEGATSGRPQHRPVFRPDVDERPLSDYLVSSDIDPYSIQKPSLYRPDDISQTPPFDGGPSYGDHRPQDIPYPERPRPGQSSRPEDPYRPRPDPYTPQDSNRPQDPYRPDQDSYKPNDPYGPVQDPYRPQNSNRPQDPYRPLNDYPEKPKPDSNDVLQFGYGKPDPYRPEKPTYNYFIRPNRKPKPQDEYHKPTKPINDPTRPVVPPKPVYTYDSQYASNYGQNDNSVHVAIYDPPRPYIPIKDRPNQQNYEQGYLGYGTYSSQNSYSSQSQNSYTGSITEIGYDQKPSFSKPGTNNQGSYTQNSQSYGGNKPIDAQNGYQRPNDKYKPQGDQNSYGGGQNSYSGGQNSYSGGQNSYGGGQNYYGGGQNSYSGSQNTNGGNQNSNYGGQNAYGDNNYGGNQQQSQSSYGSSASQSYGENRPHDQGYQKPQKPSYNRPSYSGDKGDYGYGSSQGTYGGTQGYYNSNKGSSYGGSSYGSQSYGSNAYGSQYGSSQGLYGSYGGNQGSYGSYGGNQASYGGNQASYGGNQASYGGNQASYASNQASYGSNQGSYGSNQGSYGGNQASYGSNQGSYGSYNGNYGSQSSNGHGNRPIYDYEIQKPGYGDEKPIHDTKPGYDNQKPEYDRPNPGYGNQKPGYGNQKPDYDRPDSGYGNQKPGYDDKPGYGNQKPAYDRPNQGYGDQNTGYDEKPGYNNAKPDYVNQKPLYNNQKPLYDNQKPAYGNDRPDPGYDSQDDGYGNPGYGNNKVDHTPKPGYGSPNDGKPGYESEKPMGPDGGYGPQNFRPEVKPVYEYEMDKPTNVPSYIARPGGDVVTSRPVVIGDYERPVYKDPGMSYAACFKRVLAGRRALRSFVRKVVPCERLEDCRRECALEKRFHCESFNYRLDQSFRGKGLCELMTKPIEAFDRLRDFVDDKNYDFYEVDRNSLEPNCPETLRGPGLLHSGFLSSKPDRTDQNLDRVDERPNRVDQRPIRVDFLPNRMDQRPNRVDFGPSRDQSGWRDRNDWMYRDRFSLDDRRSHGNRFEDHIVPYQIGQARSDDDGNWGQYGGDYGGQYYKDRNDYHKSINHWGLSARPVDFRKSHDFDYHSLGKNLDLGFSKNDFHQISIDTGKGSYGYGSWKRGRWNGSGNIQETGAERRDGGEEDAPSESHSGNECYSRRKPGMSLSSGAIRRSVIARNVVECETACFGETEFKCVSYSYRYSTSRGTDNCFLSERPYRGLEMSADSASDVYAMSGDKSCAVPSRPWVESECFWHVRSDTAVVGSAVKAALTVAGLGACEAECIRAQGFFCRGFSFRFDSPTIGDEDIHNCILTSSPTTRLDRTDTPRHELYARGNYGRGCEPAVYDDAQNGECYLQYDKAAKLTDSAIRGRARVKDEQGCGAACTEAPFRCLSFSYNNNAPPPSDNCLLSDIRLFDLQRGVDYLHSVDDWLFAFDVFNSRCFRKASAEDRDHSPELPHPIPSSDEDHGPSGPGYLPDPPEVPYIPTGPSEGGSFKPPSETDTYGPPPEHSGPSGPEKTYPIEPNPRPDIDYRPGYQPPDITNINFRPYRPQYPDPEPHKPSRPERPDPDYGWPSHSPERPSYRPDPPSYRPERPSYRPDPPSYRPDPPSYRPDPPSYRPDPPSYRPDPPNYRPEQPSYIPSRPEQDRPFRPTEVYPKPDSGFRPGFRPEIKPGYDRPRPQKPVYQGDRENGPIESSWRHYTVSGLPCRAGTKCAQNRIVGHWACEPEGGEIGSWDYCCAPTHRCGYSEGFHKPWCYVGHKEDQWRPCSEKYYPYHHHKTPHPSQGQKEQSRPWRDTPSSPGNSPWPVKAITPPPPDYIPHWDKPPGPYLSESDRKYWDDLYEDGPKAYYDKYGNPLPGYSRVPTENRPYIRYKHNHRPSSSSGQWVPVSEDPPVPGLGAPRYWPVAYLHREPPPNITYYRYNETEPAPSRHNTTMLTDPAESRADDGHTIDDDRFYSNGHSTGDNRDHDSRRNGERRNHNDFGSTDSRRNDNRDSESRNKGRSSDDRFRGSDNHRRNYDSSRDNDDSYRANDNRRRNYDNSRDSDRYDNDCYRGNDNRRRNNDDSREGYDNHRRNNYDSREDYDNRRRNYDYSREDYNNRGRISDDSREGYDNRKRNNDSGKDGYGNNRGVDNNPTEDSISRDHDRNNDSDSKESGDSRGNDSKTLEISNTRDAIDKIEDEKIRDQKKIDNGKTDNIFNTNIETSTDKSITTEASIDKVNNSEVEQVKPDDTKQIDDFKGIDDKLGDFSKSIEVLDIEDAKGEKLSELKTLEAEERQIEEIGRLLASRRGSKLVIEKQSQDLENKNIAVDKDTVEFNFGNRFATTERRGVIKRISKDEIERDRADKSLELSETTYVRPPRVLSTTDNIRKAIVNGKVFYDATLRDESLNKTRRAKNLRRSESSTPSIINNSNFGRKKVVKTRNVNPVRRVKRVYRKRYNPGEVRRRLLERDRSKNSTETKPV